MPITKEEICSAALVLVGENPITSFTDGSTGANISSALYTTIVRSALSSFPWTFASDQIALGAVSENEPISGWAYAYVIPTEIEVLRINSVNVSDQPVEFDRVGIYIYTDADAGSEPVLYYTKPVEPAFFPSDFVWALTLDLAIAFAGALDRTDRLPSLERQAVRAWSVAKLSSSQGRTNRRLRLNTLVTQR